jgi:hypothetical protein
MATVSGAPGRGVKINHLRKIDTNILEKALMSKTSDMQETADDLNNHPMVAAEDRKIDEISRAAQNTVNDGQGGTETGQVDPEPKAKTLRRKGEAFLRGQSLSTILLTLVAVLLAGLLFVLARVVSFFSGSRKSGNRQRRR